MDEVLKFIEKAHEGQMRRGREPYVNHPMRVAIVLREVFKCVDEVLYVALMHDVVEDTKYGFEDCFKFLVSDEAKEALRILTRKGGETSTEHFIRVLHSGNVVALCVKWADAIDNAEFTEADIVFTEQVLGREPHTEKEKYVNRITELETALRAVSVQ